MIEAVRCWCEPANATGRCQRLHGMLEQRDCGLLAPAFDSLFQIYEAAFSRSIVSGGDWISEDEISLLALTSVSPSMPRIAFSEAAGLELLQCATQSVREMLRLLERP